MSQAFAGKNAGRLLALSLAALLAVAAAAVAASASDAATNGIGTATADDDWKDGESGHIDVPVSLTAESNVLFKMYVDSYDESDPDKTVMKTGLSEGTQTVTLSISLSSGNHTVTVYAYIDEDGDESTTGDQTSIGTTSVEVHVDKGIWDKATSYIAIIAIAIIIVIAVLYYIRSNPKAKPTTTFTQLEEEKKAGKDSKAPAEKKASTERRRYDASSESKEAVPAEEPKEKEASSFSELADEKKAKKSSGKDGEGKKLKYVSSRRK
ncbi:MAG: hypothetical protein VZQ28_02280 [Methanomethylophilus sp.]|nr:hypothetical protein [Methanomethylophilus sp.]WII08924.1 hypothetical protein O8W32_07060 [Methanomassiliicoccales archaeon LGM-DZ1]